MAVILKAMPFGSPRRERQHGVLAIERLNCGLLIDAEHRRMLRRMQIQPNDIGSFGLKVGSSRPCSPQADAVAMHACATLAPPSCG